MTRRPEPDSSQTNVVNFAPHRKVQNETTSSLNPAERGAIGSGPAAKQPARGRDFDVEAHALRIAAALPDI